MKDYCFTGIAIVGFASFSFAVHTTSDCDDVDLVQRHLEDELCNNYGFEAIRSFKCCDFETYWYHSCRINLD